MKIGILLSSFLLLVTTISAGGGSSGSCCWQGDCVSTDEWLVGEDMSCKCASHGGWTDCKDHCKNQHNNWVDHGDWNEWSDKKCKCKDGQWKDCEYYDDHDDNNECCWQGDCVSTDEWLGGEDMTCKCTSNGGWTDCKDHCKNQHNNWVDHGDWNEWSDRKCKCKDGEWKDCEYDNTEPPQCCKHGSCYDHGDWWRGTEESCKCDDDSTWKCKDHCKDQHNNWVDHGDWNEWSDRKCKCDNGEWDKCRTSCKNQHDNWVDHGDWNEWDDKKCKCDNGVWDECKYECVDKCPHDPLKFHPGQCGCGIEDIDSDGDGLADCIDRCPHDPFKFEPGVCGCGQIDTYHVATGAGGGNDWNTSEQEDSNATMEYIVECGLSPNEDDSDDGHRRNRRQLR